MPSLPWSDGLSRMLDRAEAYPGMWSGVEVRLALREGPNQTWLAHYAYFQGLFELIDVDSIEQPITNPVILQCSITMETWSNLLRAWAAGEPFRLGVWTIRPPEDVTHLSDDWTLHAIDNWSPMLVPITLDGERVVPQGWVSHGQGSDVQLMRGLFYETSLKYGFEHVEEFILEYLGRPLRDPSYPSFYFVFPWGAWLTLQVTGSAVRAKLWLRRPLTSSQFWARTSPSSWSVKLPPLSWGPSAFDGIWEHSQLTFPVASDESAISVWAGRGEEPELRATVRVDPLTPQRQQEELLVQLYERSGRTKYPFPLAIAPTSDRGFPQLEFESAVTNALAALGYAVMATGVKMQLTGVDVVAFGPRGKAWAISITLGNDIQRKLSTLLSQREWLEESLSKWDMRLAIVSASRWEDIVASARADCESASVVLISRDDLQLLASETPDFHAFREATGL